MLNPISIAFKRAKQENRPALLTYTVAGDSTKKQSLEILKSISKNADILELGVPHNTPVADGSQIQTSSYRAIKNGIKTNNIFQIVKDFYPKSTTCIILLLKTHSCNIVELTKINRLKILLSEKATNSLSRLLRKFLKKFLIIILFIYTQVLVWEKLIC